MGFWKRHFSKILNVVLISMILYKVLYKIEDREKHLELTTADEVELEQPGKLLNASGQLNEVGWSRHYLKDFSFDDVAPVFWNLKLFTPLKYKRFNYYSFTFDKKIFQLAVSNVNYGSVIFANYFDYDSRTFLSQSLKLLPFAHTHLFPNLIDNPMNCTANKIAVEKDSLSLEVDTQLVNSTCVSRIKIVWGEELQGHFIGRRDIHEEDLYDIMPISEDNRYFFYNLKTYNNRCEGELKVNSQKSVANTTECLAMIDHGRGIFHYRTSWFWGAASGWMDDGSAFSLNIGHGISNPSVKSIEDSVKINGRIIKLNPLEVTYDKEDVMKGFSFTTPKKLTGHRQSAHITFESRHTHTNGEDTVIFFSSLKYVYGYYSGTIIDDQGKAIDFKNIPGIVEIASFRW